MYNAIFPQGDVFQGSGCGKKLMKLSTSFPRRFDTLGLFEFSKSSYFVKRKVLYTIKKALDFSIIIR
jgi:hypothetical protein